MNKFIALSVSVSLAQYIRARSSYLISVSLALASKYSYASDSDTQNTSMKTSDEEKSRSLLVGDWLVHSVHLLVDKVVGIHGTTVPEFGPNSSFRRRTIFELIRSSAAAPK